MLCARTLGTDAARIGDVARWEVKVGPLPLRNQAQIPVNLEEIFPQITPKPKAFSLEIKTLSLSISPNTPNVVSPPPSKPLAKNPTAKNKVRGGKKVLMRRNYLFIGRGFSQAQVFGKNFIFLHQPSLLVAEVRKREFSHQDIYADGFTGKNFTIKKDSHDLIPHLLRVELNHLLRILIVYWFLVIIYLIKPGHRRYARST